MMLFDNTQRVQLGELAVILWCTGEKFAQTQNILHVSKHQRLFLEVSHKTLTIQDLHGVSLDTGPYIIKIIYNRIHNRFSMYTKNWRCDLTVALHIRKVPVIQHCFFFKTSSTARPPWRVYVAVWPRYSYRYHLTASLLSVFYKLMCVGQACH